MSTTRDRHAGQRHGIRKPLPPAHFVVHDTNAEPRWTPDLAREALTPQARLFVRNHTSTPTIDPQTYRLRVYGDGLREPRSAKAAYSLSLADLARLPRLHTTTLLECTGNGRSLFARQQGTPAPGTPWGLGAVGAQTWEGVRLRDVLEALGLADDALSVLATGLDDPFVEDGVDHGPVRRPLPLAAALDVALLAWGANGEALLPDHGFPLRLVVPGWVGVASIKWLGSLEVARTELASPWSTTFYRMRGPQWPADSAPLTLNPVRSAWDLEEEAILPRQAGQVLRGRAWSGAGPVTRVEVSFDGGEGWRPAAVEQSGPWTRFAVRWPGAPSGPQVLMARATDVAGRTQPLVARANDEGYLFDAVVRHPILVS